MIWEALTRGWENFIARTHGPMNIRFVIQPAVAIFLGILAGLRDARNGHPAYLWAILTKGHMRGPLMRAGMRDLVRVLILAMLLDFVYQLRVQRAVYALELIFTAVTLAGVPYVLIRGPVNRLARRFRSSAPSQDKGINLES